MEGSTLWYGWVGGRFWFTIVGSCGAGEDGRKGTSQHRRNRRPATPLSLSLSIFSLSGGLVAKDLDRSTRG